VPPGAISGLAPGVELIPLQDIAAFERHHPASAHA
jgi:hypothetical protein